jgi:hypothetical protein
MRCWSRLIGFGWRFQWRDAVQGAVRPVLIVVCLVLAQGLSQVLEADHLLFGVILVASPRGSRCGTHPAHSGFALDPAW